MDAETEIGELQIVLFKTQVSYLREVTSQRIQIMANRRNDVDKHVPMNDSMTLRSVFRAICSILTPNMIPRSAGNPTINPVL